MFIRNLAQIIKLPSRSFNDLNSLPEKQGIYFVVAGNEIIYIGRSRNIRKRWVGEHHRKEIISDFHSNSTIYCLFVSDHEELCVFEKEMIDTIDPIYNNFRQDVISLEPEFPEAVALTEQEQITEWNREAYSFEDVVYVYFELGLPSKLRTNASHLFLGLLHFSNKIYLREEFSLGNPVVMSLAGMSSIVTLVRTRKRLSEFRLFGQPIFSYTTGKDKHTSGIYRLELSYIMSCYCPSNPDEE